MKSAGKLIFAVLAMLGALQCLAAEIALSSETDFTEMTLELRRADNLNPDSMELSVTLSPDAQRRLALVTRQEMHNYLQLSINGIAVSNAMIHSVIEGPSLVIIVPRKIARDLLPTLLEPSTP
ncbi:hypothetical protein PMI29_02384 [Pseudomonas sp. GM49]|uniref:hypothetical protein n=1 Tax=Pseudomonas sp. GM49 TaxID=1144331 RepID=UPI0002705950|nr:hypothetical protein [Pseudomonas sp. GM49]EJM67372.1 hypothetical protein PMI29_02384 [Pseudomonas sp. GM49]